MALADDKSPVDQTNNSPIITLGLTSALFPCQWKPTINQAHYDDQYLPTGHGATLVEWLGVGMATIIGHMTYWLGVWADHNDGNPRQTLRRYGTQSSEFATLVDV